MNEKIFYLAQFLKYIPHVESVYKKNLRVHFATYMSLISLDGTEVMFAQSEILTEKKLNSDHIIEQLIEESHCNKRKYFSRDEQISVLEALIKAGENRLYSFVKED